MDLTDEEKKAIKALQRLGKKWPKTLVVFASGGALSIRKPPEGQFYGHDTQVATVSGIPNDGGDN